MKILQGVATACAFAAVVMVGSAAFAQGRGIGHAVSGMAKQGVHGQQLAAQIHALNQARGVGQPGGPAGGVGGGMAPGGGGLGGGKMPGGGGMAGGGKGVGGGKPAGVGGGGGMPGVGKPGGIGGGAIRGGGGGGMPGGGKPGGIGGGAMRGGGGMPGGVGRGKK